VVAAADIIHDVLIDLPSRARVMCHVAGNGPPVVLLHGWGASWYLWKDTMLALAGAGFSAYAPDHIGCGHSDKPRLCYTPHDYAVYLEGLLAALRLDNINLVGHSLGGHIALSYALQHPDRVSRLVLVGPAYSPLRQAVRTRAQMMLAVAGLPLLGELALRLMPAGVMRRLMNQPWGGFHRPDRLPADFLDRMVADYLQNASPLVCNTIRYLVIFSLPGLSRFRGDADLLPYLGKLNVPTLVIWGQRDALLNPSSYPLLAARIPGAMAHPIADAGHTPPMEAPLEFQRTLLDFLMKRP